MERFFLLACGVSGFAAVALGAFGAHGLEARLADLADGALRMGWWETAAHYHLVHSLALAICAYLARRVGGPAHVSGYCFLGGVLVFSGTLYLMALTGVRWLGAVTPLGGLLLLAGWAALVWAARAVGT